jgi:NAD(P)H-hydrate epimerase
MVRIPAVTAEEMAEVDRLMTQRFHIDLEMMMENAGRALALQSVRMRGRTRLEKILVLVGKGNNGGGGLVAARHLHDWGENTEVILASGEKSIKEVPAKQLDIAKSIGVKVSRGGGGAEFATCGLIIDALLGYNQRGNPRGEIAKLVRRANESGKPILALDIPTGLDPDTGVPNEPCIVASQTLTLALPKRGLYMRRARPYVGALFLADISVPRELYRRFGVRAPVFASDGIVRLLGSWAR